MLWRSDRSSSSLPPSWQTHLLLLLGNLFDRTIGRSSDFFNTQEGRLRRSEDRGEDVRHGKNALSCSRLCSRLISTFFRQHRLKASQRGLVREFVTLTQTGEKTAIFCLAHHDWKLDAALDNFFSNPDVFYREQKALPDRRKIDQVYSRYRGKVIGTRKASPRSAV